MADVDLEGCGDHSCVVAKPGGMGTNGGCRCERVHLRRAVHVLRERLRAVEAERDECVHRQADALTANSGLVQAIGEQRARAEAAERRVAELEALLAQR